MAIYSNQSNIIKKVLFILDYPLSEWKGTQRAIFEFANYLHDLGFQVTLLENSGKSGYGLNSDITVPFKNISLSFNRFETTKILRNIIRMEKPDLIYTANIISPFIPTFGVRTVFGMHSLNASAIPFMKLSAKIKFYFAQIFLSAFSLIFWKRKAVMFHAENTDQLNWVRKIYFNRFKASLVGLPVECINDRDSLKQNPKNEKFSILFFGALDKERGFGFFLRVIDSINSNKNIADFQFVIVGNGTMKSFAQEAQQHYGNVKYIVRASEEEKNEIMIHSDLFVFPSWIENYSVTTVEAQLRGLPAIVLDYAPLRNIVENGKTGFLLDGINIVEKIVEKINFYYQIWNNNYELYAQMRLNISDQTTRLCKNRILPDFYKMLLGFSLL